MQKHLRKKKPAAAKSPTGLKSKGVTAPKAGSAPAPHHAMDLRSTLEWLRRQGDLIETDKEVDPDLEVTGLQKHMDGGCPVLFENVKGKPNHRVVTNLFGDMNVINKMFGWKSDAERVRKLAAGAAQAAQAGDHRAEGRAGSAARDQEAEGRQQVGGADPAYDLRARAHRRLRASAASASTSSMAAPTSATTA